MERNYDNEHNEQHNSRRFPQGPDRNPRWPDDDRSTERDRDDHRYSREDSEQDRFFKYTRGAPYSSYSSINSGHSAHQGSDPYEQSYDRGRDWGRSAYSAEQYRDQGRNGGFDRDYSQGYGRSFGETGAYQASRRGQGHGDQNRSYGSQSGMYGAGSGSFGNLTSGYAPYGSHSYTPDPSHSSYPSSSTPESGYRSNRYSPGSYRGSEAYKHSNFGSSSVPTSDAWYQGTPGQPNTPWSQRQNSKSGRGPKGYQRSDDRIKEELSDLLTHNHDIDPSEVEIQVSGGEVSLTGTVEDRQEKRLAEDLAASVPGVSEVHNQLRVGIHPQNQGRRREDSQPTSPMHEGSALRSSNQQQPSDGASANSGKPSVP